MGGGERKTVLIVDDHDDARDMAARALGRAGFPVVSAGRLGELEEILDERQPDLILMDVRMPELFGDDVGMVLRTVHNLRAPIYLYSSLDADDLARRAEQAQLDGHICKAEGLPHLVSRVREILGTS